MKVTGHKAYINRHAYYVTCKSLYFPNLKSSWENFGVRVWFYPHFSDFLLTFANCGKFSCKATKVDIKDQGLLMAAWSCFRWFSDGSFPYCHHLADWPSVRHSIFMVIQSKRNNLSAWRLAFARQWLFMKVLKVRHLFTEAGVLIVHIMTVMV